MSTLEQQQQKIKTKIIDSYFKMSGTYVPPRAEVDRLYAEYEEIRRTRAWKKESTCT